MGTGENAIVASELLERNDSELESLLASKSEELHSAKFKRSLGQLTETHVVKSIKKDVARLKTVLRARAMKAEG